MSSIKIPPVTSQLFTTELDVRIDDINYGGHLGHAELISYLHEARVRFLARHGYTELNIEGPGILITTLAVNYRSEIFYADRLAVSIGIGDVSNTCVDMIYQVDCSGKTAANALTTMTFFDYHHRKVVKIPQPFLTLIS